MINFADLEKLLDEVNEDELDSTQLAIVRKIKGKTTNILDKTTKVELKRIAKDLALIREISEELAEAYVNFDHENEDSVLHYVHLFYKISKEEAKKRLSSPKPSENNQTGRMPGLHGFSAYKHKVGEIKKEFRIAGWIDMITDQNHWDFAQDKRVPWVEKLKEKNLNEEDYMTAKLLKGKKITIEQLIDCKFKNKTGEEVCPVRIVDNNVVRDATKEDLLPPKDKSSEQQSVSSSPEIKSEVQSSEVQNSQEETK